jgi:hypothetical protein
MIKEIIEIRNELAIGVESKDLLFIKMQINKLDTLIFKANKNTVVLPDVIRRYFVVVYRATNGKTMLDGSINMDTDGTYLEREKAMVTIKENNKDFKGVIITNLIELTKEEYACWIG